MADYPPKGLHPSMKLLPDWIQRGVGDAEYYCEEKGSTFPAQVAPEKCPDLSTHGNHMADALKENPGLYEKYRNVKTPGGVSLAKCIKTGIDNKGHPMIKTVGLVAGDEDSFTTFKELFDPVISARHNGYAPDAKHVTDMDPSKLSTTQIDPTGKYILTTRCRTGRSIRGLRLPPACTFEERREVERVMVDALSALTGELKGDYFPLHGSQSYAPKPTGMSEEKQEELRKAGNLFQEPDSTLLLSSGSGRHWPDARGIFHNEARNFFVWINEEDHIRIISMQVGDGMREIFTRFKNACETIERVLKEKGYAFMHNDHLGYMLTCPSNCGTGLRAGAMIKIPLVSSREDFKDLCGAMGLQARGTAGVDSASVGGTWDISNADRLGKSEVQLCNVMIEGTAKLIQWEQKLEAGGSINDEVKAVMAAKGVGAKL